MVAVWRTRWNRGTVMAAEVTLWQAAQWLAASSSLFRFVDCCFAFFFISASNSFPRKANIVKPMEGLISTDLLLGVMICDFMQFPVDVSFFSVFFFIKDSGQQKMSMYIQDNMHWDGLCGVKWQVFMPFGPPKQSKKHIRAKRKKRKVCLQTSTRQKQIYIIQRLAPGKTHGFLWSVVLGNGQSGDWEKEKDRAERKEVQARRGNGNAPILSSIYANRVFASVSVLASCGIDPHRPMWSELLNWMRWGNEGGGCRGGASSVILRAKRYAGVVFFSSTTFKFLHLTFWTEKCVISSLRDAFTFNSFFVCNVNNRNLMS